VQTGVLRISADLRDWVSRTPLRLYAAILLFTLVLVAVFSLRADKLLREEVEKKELNEGLETANLSAYFLEEHFQQTIALLQSVVQSESFVRDWRKRDGPALARQVEQAQRLQSDFALMSVYDVDGTMRAVDPQNINLLGTNFAYRDWYKGVVKTWSPYVSKVYRTRAAPQQLVVAVAVPIFEDRKPVGIIATGYSLERISGWLGDGGADQGTVFVVDQTGHLLAKPGIDTFAEPVDMSYLEPVNLVRAGRSGSGTFWNKGQEEMFSYAPIPSLGWGVLVSRPVAVVRQQVNGARRQQALMALAFGVAAIICGLLVGALYVRQQATVRKLEAMREAEGTYYSLIQGATYGVFRADSEKMVVANKALAKILGYDSEDELVEKNMKEIYFDPEERARLVERYKLDERAEGVETTWRRKDGSPLPVRLGGRIIRDDSGEVLFFEGIVEDMSARRELEEKLRNSHKQAALGRLIAGAAHEINNPLTAILGYADILSSQSAEPESKTMAEKIQAQTRRARTVVGNLISFAQQNKTDKTFVDVNQIVDNAIRLEDLNVGPGKMKFIRELTPGLPKIWGDEYQLLQVSLHIMNNSIDAVPSVGGEIRAITRVEGSSVVIEFQDNGPGFSNPENVFDPFYTTKEFGEGVGLGLSASFGIVQEHNGEIKCFNLPQGGACIRISFASLDARGRQAAPQRRTVST
jgi:PAS domain S-box-containing protein